MSSVPPIKITYQGVSVPQSTAIRNGILSDYNFAFGGNLNVTSNGTSQAHVADNLTQSISESNAAVAMVVAGVDPATNEGRFQDAIGRIYFLERKGAISSVVQATVTGQAGAILPVGSLARDVNGIYWSSTAAVTFPSAGVINVQFACQESGPIQLGIGELNTIARASLGWDAVNNTGAATVGSLVESRADFEARRFGSVAKNAHGSAAAIRGSVFEVPGVIDVFTYDNFKDVPIKYGVTDYTIPANCVYVAAVGGTAEDVANAIYLKKDGGCNLTGNTTVIVEDTTDFASEPYPTYEISFNRPAALPIKFAVNLRFSTGLPTNIVELVKNSVIATFNGENGFQRARIGGAIFASTYYGPIAQISNSVQILSIKIGVTTVNLDSILIGIDQVPTITADDIQVNF